MKELQCKNCGHEWAYKGQNKWWATCPHCLWKVKVIEESGKNEFER